MLLEKHKTKINKKLIARSLICNCPLLKGISFDFEIALLCLGQFQNFQKYTRAIYPKSPSQTCDY